MAMPTRSCGMRRRPNRGSRWRRTTSGTCITEERAFLWITRKHMRFSRLQRNRGLQRLRRIWEKCSRTETACSRILREPLNCFIRPQMQDTLWLRALSPTSITRESWQHLIWRKRFTGIHWQPHRANRGHRENWDTCMNRVKGRHKTLKLRWPGIKEPPTRETARRSSASA